MSPWIILGWPCVTVGLLGSVASMLASCTALEERPEAQALRLAVALAALGVFVAITAFGVWVMSR